MHLFFRQACALAFRSLPLAGVLSALLFSSAAMGATYSFSFVSNEYMKSMYGTFTTAPATGPYLGAESVVSGEIQGGATIMTNGGKDFVVVRYWGDVVPGGHLRTTRPLFLQVRTRHHGMCRTTISCSPPGTPGQDLTRMDRAWQGVHIWMHMASCLPEFILIFMMLRTPSNTTWQCMGPKPRLVVMKRRCTIPAALS